MTNCTLTVSEAAEHWPDGVISVKLTMNPYLLTLAEEAAERTGMKIWELINVALWEKLGKPDQKSMLNYAAELDLSDDDPKWKKRLKLTARHEIEVMEHRQEQMTKCNVERDNGNRGEDEKRS